MPHLPNDTSILEGILADMLRSALTWDDLNGQKAEKSTQVEVLTEKTRRIHCLSPSERTQQILGESEGENGYLNSNQGSSMDVRGPKRS